MKKNCKKCSAEFDGPEFGPDEEWLNRLPGLCQKCSDEQAQATARAEKERKSRERESRWRDLCPPAYRDTVTEKLPHPDKAAEILAWNYGSTGLLLHGPTRTGKTRCAWLLVRKMFDAGKSIRVLDSSAGFLYLRLFLNDGAPDWFQDHCDCAFLVLDDIFKAKLTESFEAAVFAIVDHRLSHKLPIVATLNDTGETLAARMSPDRGDAFVARLKEMCQVVKF
jgi:DNA replication protein DnaC